MRALSYKRIHKGDPDRNGSFGVWDGMRRVKKHRVDAVTGVGGKLTKKERLIGQVLVNAETGQVELSQKQMIS